MGGSEIIVILIVALLFLGPDKLPQAAKQISKGIRDIKKQSRALQQQIENDDQIGGALRDIKSALRGVDEPVRPKPLKPPKPLGADAAPAALAAATAADGESAPASDDGAPAPDAAASAAEAAAEGTATEAGMAEAQTSNAPPLRLPPTVGEPDPDAPADGDDDEELAKMIRPAEGTVAKGSEPKHG